jgi:hypothetical protein
MNLEQVQYEVNCEVERILLDGEFKQSTAEQRKAIGESVLDIRAVPYKMWYNDDVLVVQGGSAIRQLNYYGGFEYVDQECVYTAGDYVFFSGDDSRVSSVLNVLNGKEQDEDELDEEDEE